MSDRIISAPSNQAYRDGWERAFGKQGRPEVTERDVARSRLTTINRDGFALGLWEMPDSEGGETD